MIKWIFKWVFRLVLLAVILGVVFFLSLNSLLRVLIEHNIRAQTGMDAEIGRFQLGLLEPTISLENLKIYNPPSFGGTPFLKIPEIHVEYDRAAFARRQLHLTLVRFNLGELDIVRNARGQTNIFSLGLAWPKNPTGRGNRARSEFQRQTGLEFTGIDVLNVSVGTLKYIDLKDQRHNRTQEVGLQNQVIPNVKTPADLAGLAVLIGLRSGDFFDSLVDPGADKSGALKLIW
jgi:uncharacterized protein involved in outer membrane biogenesis